MAGKPPSADADGLKNDAADALGHPAVDAGNVGPIRQKGIELSADHRIDPSISMFVNYSWQGETEILDDPNPFPSIELALPPTHRFNGGATYAGRRLLGSLVLNYTDQAFWSDVLNSPYHGFTDAFTMVNGSFGVRWTDRVTTTVKTTNLMNRQIQQHVFGDILGRSVTLEAKFHVSR